MRLLLLSNAKTEGMAYLEYAIPHFQSFFAGKIERALFIPFANAAGDYLGFEAKAAVALAQAGIKLESITRFADPVQAVREAQAVIVGGGSTWKLLRDVRALGLLDAIRERVADGMPYAGWSAGANLACPTIMTTNDMPICDPKGFDALDFIPFQINPHYLHGNPPGFKGETREERIGEFGKLNPDTWVAGIREGTGFVIEDGAIRMVGELDCRVFKAGTEPCEVPARSDFSFLMSSQRPCA
ncbi:dipeptidase PepE [Aquitalea sp. S1-19]|nr:dipeptidase PepE [Aquitalea sp. S1-19]